MATTLFGPSLPVFGAACGTRTILQGDPAPGGAIGDEYWGVFTVPQANLIRQSISASPFK
jgi:hypothetical protein